MTKYRIGPMIFSKMMIAAHIHFGPFGFGFLIKSTNANIINAICKIRIGSTNRIVRSSTMSMLLPLPFFCLCCYFAAAAYSPCNCIKKGPPSAVLQHSLNHHFSFSNTCRRASRCSLAIGHPLISSSNCCRLPKPLTNPFSRAAKVDCVSRPASG